MKDWLKLINEVSDTDLWGLVIIDFYYSQRALESPAEFLKTFIPKIFSPRLDLLSFHKTLVSVCVQLLGTDFGEVMRVTSQCAQERKPLSPDMIDKLSSHYAVFGEDANYEEVLRSAEGTLPTVPEQLFDANKQSSSFDEKLSTALKVYAEHVAGGERTQSRYDDSKFQASARRKAAGVFERLSNKKCTSNLAIVSVGGADGTELMELCKLTSSTHGILLEYSDDAMAAANQKAKAAEILLRGFAGDLMDKLDEAMKYAIRLRQSGEVTSVVVTANAVLHELFRRSANFNLRTYFSKLFEADVIVGREPISPPNWKGDVVLSGNFDKAAFARLAKVVRSHNDDLRDTKVEALGTSGVELDPVLAIETLTKVFYAEDFLYELQEQVTSISSEKLGQDIRLALAESHSAPDIEVITSNSFSVSWESAGLRVESVQGAQLDKPLTHMWYSVKRKK